MNIDKVSNLSKEIKKNILLAAMNAGASSAHIGGALSLVDILSVLYEEVANIDSKEPLGRNRSRIILSKGHGCLALYGVLAEKGFITKKELKSFEKSGSFLLESQGVGIPLRRCTHTLQAG